MAIADPSPEPRPKGQVGRPRRFDEDTERRLIYDAALAVLQRNDFSDISVADILSEAGLSTRSFYRHFDSKDQLLCALIRRDADRTAQGLTTRIDATPNPVEALAAWVDEVLSIGWRTGRAKRVAMLASPGAMAAEGYAEEHARASRLMSSPLIELLEAGLADGSFPWAEPKSDARMISSITWDAAGIRPPRAKDEPLGDKAEVHAAILAFCDRALGRRSGS